MFRRATESRGLLVNTAGGSILQVRYAPTFHWVWEYHVVSVEQIFEPHA